MIEVDKRYVPERGYFLSVKTEVLGEPVRASMFYSREEALRISRNGKEAPDLIEDVVSSMVSGHAQQIVKAAVEKAIKDADV